MKKIISSVCLFLAAGSIVSSFACTTIIVGKDATTDGSVIISRNDDTDDAHSPYNLYRHPELKNKFEFQSNENKFVYTLPVGTLGYTAMPNYATMNKHNPSLKKRV